MKKEKSKKTFIIVITTFIALSMIVSIFAVVVDNQGSKLEYNNQKFTLTEQGYKTKINGNYYIFQYFPAEIESITLTPEAKSLLDNSQGLIVLFDPNADSENLLYLDFARFSMDEKLDRQIFFAVTNESAAYALPVLSCQNATSSLPIIYFNLSTEVSVTNDGSCIIANAKLREILGVEERMVYHMLGVME